MDHGKSSSRKNISVYLNSSKDDPKKNGPVAFQKSLAERILLRRFYTGQRAIKNCAVPNTRAKFLIVFSPDGMKLASTNGNHNVYIINISTKRILNTLSGHRRTPWALAFHPTNNNILASGCLDGEVRVWNLEDDTCETWQSPGKTVIASLTFHPKVKLLVIATYHDLYFWDWSTSTVLRHASTGNEEEKIRYVKFDSSGDKLITAIALKHKILSQLDAISFREVYEFTRERDVLMEFHRIQIFIKKHIAKIRDCEPEIPPVIEVAHAETVQDLINTGKITPLLCTSHYYTFQNFLNVELFCPTEFSMKVMKMLRSNSAPVTNLSETCCLCRYAWLYDAVFKFQVLCNPRNHICEEYRSYSGEKHPWAFTNMRKLELMAENENDINGLTENMLRFCFEHYARKNIAPTFVSCIPNSVCSKCFTVEDVPSYSYDDKPFSERNTYAHNVSNFCDGVNMSEECSENVTLRSDCFLNLCQIFNFEPKGSFAAFLISFAEVYQFLPSLQQISTREDDGKLAVIMTEWEYLYCKIMLIGSIIEGDNQMFLRKRPPWPKSCEEFEAEINESKDYFCGQQQSTRKIINPLNAFSRSYDMDHFINRIPRVSGDGLGSSSQVDTECCLCKQFDGGDTVPTDLSMQMLQKELDIMAAAIARRFEGNTQRTRTEKLFRGQFDHNLNRIGSALFRTIQTTQKCILAYLAATIRELKKVIKWNFFYAPVTDKRFREIFLRMFVFVVRRVISFCNALLEVICNYDYNVEELTTKINNEYLNAHSPHFLFASLFNRYRVTSYRKKLNFVVDKEMQPVFNEERVTRVSDLADDELNYSAVEESNSRCDLDGHSSRCNPSAMDNTDLSKVDNRVQHLAERGVVASNVHLMKHLKVLDLIAEHLQIHRNHLDTYDLLLLQNVNALFDYFYHHMEDGADHRNIYHPLHRLQMWDFSRLEVPNISSKVVNLIVTECKVHNDATIAISHDDTRVAVLLSPSQFCQPNWLGIFSLEWKTLGHILCAVSLNQIAVSLSFSPTNEHLVAGYSYTYRDNVKMADVIAVKQEMQLWKDFTRLVRPLPVITSILETPNLEKSGLLTTINCIQWLPTPGQGLILGNSLGDMKYFY